MNDEKPCVTGKQVLADAVTLAKDTGSYIFQLGKRIFRAIKNALDNANKDAAHDTAPSPNNAA